MNLILFGYKSCGKTTLGKLLSGQLDRPFLDTDSLLTQLFLEQRGESLSPRTIYQTLGEKGFRALESKVLSRLKRARNTIISLGGGLVLNPKQVSFLAKLGQLAYLKLDKETIKKRLIEGELPAFLDPSDIDASFERMYNERKKIYEKIPALLFDLQSKTQDQIIQEICAVIQTLECQNG